MLSTDGSAEHYWPNIKKAILENPTGQPDDQLMEPQCPLCFERFDITTFSKPSGNAPTCVVLFCGHVMCRGCLGQTERHNSRDVEKKCPCCRTPLACTQCGQASKTFAVPDANTTSDSVFDAPLTKPENPNTNVQPKCHRCAAGGEWLNRIDNGEYPRGAETIEPGAVRFFYGTVDALESQGRPVTPGSVSSAFGSVTNDEYQMLTSRRNDFMSQRRLELETTNPWFASDFGRDRYGSSSHRHEHRREINIHDYRDPLGSPLDSQAQFRLRETNIHDYRDPLDSPLDSQAQLRLQEYIDYQAPLDPHLDAEARFRRSDFEERRRIHDRLPDEISLQDQLSSLSLGGGQRLDPFGRSQRGDERGHAQHRFDESRFDERLRLDADMDGRVFYAGFDEPSFDERPRRDVGMGGRVYGGFDEPSFDEHPRRGAGMTYGDFDEPSFGGRAVYAGLEEPSFGERARRDTGMTNYGDFGGRDTGRDAFSGAQYGRDTGNRYSDQYGRDTGNGTPHARNTGNPFGETQYGVDADHFPNIQHHDDPFSRTERGRRPRSHYESFISQDGELLAEFERNPEAQRLHRESAERWTEEERNDPFFIRWRKEAAAQEALRRAAGDELYHAIRRRDGRSERRR